MKSNLFLEPIELQGVEPPVLDPRVQQLVDRSEPLTSLEVDAPACPHPLDVLLVVDGDHVVGAAGLREEGVEAVEGPDVQDRESLEAPRDGWDPVAVIARGPGRVDSLRPVQRKGVEPVRNSVEYDLRLGGVGLDRQQVGDLAFGRGELGQRRRGPCVQPDSSSRQRVSAPAYPLSRASAGLPRRP